MIGGRADIWLGRTISTGGFIVILVGVGTLVYQAGLWLKEGQWTPFEFKLAFKWLDGKEPPSPDSSWIGINKIITFILEAPLCMGLFLVGIAMIVWGGRVIRDGREDLKPWVKAGP